MSLYWLFWVILVVAVIGIIFWYLKSRGKGGGKESLPGTTVPEEPKGEGPGTPPSEGPGEE